MLASLNRTAHDAFARTPKFAPPPSASSSNSRSLSKSSPRAKRACSAADRRPPSRASVENPSPSPRRAPTPAPARAHVPRARARSRRHPARARARREARTRGRARRHDSALAQPIATARASRATRTRVARTRTLGRVDVDRARAFERVLAHERRAFVHDEAPSEAFGVANANANAFIHSFIHSSIHPFTHSLTEDETRRVDGRKIARVRTGITARRAHSHRLQRTAAHTSAAHRRRAHRHRADPPLIATTTIANTPSMMFKKIFDGIGFSGSPPNPTDSPRSFFRHPDQRSPRARRRRVGLSLGLPFARSLLRGNHGVERGEGFIRGRRRRRARLGRRREHRLDAPFASISMTIPDDDDPFPHRRVDSSSRASRASLASSLASSSSSSSSSPRSSSRAFERRALPRARPDARIVAIIMRAARARRPTAPTAPTAPIDERRRASSPRARARLADSTRAIASTRAIRQPRRISHPRASHRRVMTRQCPPHRAGNRSRGSSRSRDDRRRRASHARARSADANETRGNESSIMGVNDHDTFSGSRRFTWPRRMGT